jgi:uncharacterized membrane protein (DUF441 family)
MVFFMLFYLCLWQGVEVRLIYHADGEIPDFPVFYWGWDFAREFLGYPGGWMEYVAALSMQSLFHSWLGAAVLTAQGWVIFLAVRACGREAGLGRPGLVALAAPLLLLWLYARYAHHAQALASLTVVALALWLLVRFRAASRGLRLGLVLVFTALLYPAAAGALPVFSLALAVMEWQRGRSWRRAMAVLLIGVAVACLEGRLLFGLAVDESWQSLAPVPWRRPSWTQPGLMPLCLLYLLLPGLDLLAWFWQGRSGRWLSSFVGVLASGRRSRLPERGGEAGRARHSHRPRQGREAALPASASFASGTSGKWMWQAACLAAAVIGVFYASQDREQKSALAVNYYAYRQMWPEALAAVRGKLADPYTACTATQAAYHTGLLMRQLPPVQGPEDLLLLGRKQLAHWKQGELYLDLGYVNEALHHLTEAVEFWGERPRLLERLVILNLAVGNIATARIYLNALARVPFHSRWARGYLERLASDPLLTGDQEVARLRSMTVKQDTVGHPGVEQQLLMLLGANSSNLMAFEYLMTYYLLTKNLDGFARRLPHIRDFPGLKLSLLWEEAMVLWARSQGQSPAAQAAPGWAECQERLDHVLQVIEACGRNEEAARTQLQSDYGNNYFFYYFFHH